MMSMLPCSFNNNMVLRRSEVDLDRCYLFVCEFLKIVYNTCINNKYNSSALWKSAISVTFC